MALEQKQVDVPKELSDVQDLVLGLIVDLKAKKPLAEVASGRLSELMAALDGFDKVGEELKLHRKEALKSLGLFVGELADALLPSA